MWCETINYDYTPVGTAPHGNRRFCNLNGDGFLCRGKYGLRMNDC